MPPERCWLPAVMSTGNTPRRWSPRACGHDLSGHGYCHSPRTAEAKSRIRRSGIVVMQYPEGVDFGEERAQLVIGIAGAGDEHIEILARVTSALEDEEVLRRLKTTDDPRYILEKLAI